MPFLTRRREFECPLRRQDQDRPAERGPHAGHRRVVSHVKHRLNGDCVRTLAWQYTHGGRDALRLRPPLPIKADPLAGCLLLQITALS